MRREKKGELVEEGRNREGGERRKHVELIERRLQEVFMFPWENLIKDV